MRNTIKKQVICMLPAFEQLGLLLLFMSIGYYFGKSGLIDHSHAKVLSVAGVYLFLPCTIFNSFSKSFTRDNLNVYAPLLIGSLIILLVLYFFARYASGLFVRQGYERKIFLYSMIVPNYGYMGYAMAEGLFGPVGLLELIIFSLPISLYTYTLGFSMLTKRSISLKKLLNPVNVAVLLGVVVGLFSIKLPNVANLFLSKSAACMAPASMLLAGLTISQFNFKSLLLSKKAYAMCALRLLLLPLAIFFVLRAVSDNTVLIRTALLFYCMPCGMNTIVFPKLVDEDCSTGASLALLSNVLSMATIPLCMALL